MLAPRTGRTARYRRRIKGARALGCCFGQQQHLPSGRAPEAIIETSGLGNPAAHDPMQAGVLVHAARRFAPRPVTPKIAAGLALCRRAR